MGSNLKQLYQTSHLYGGNASYIETWYESWLEDPQSVPETWRAYFESMPPAETEEEGHIAVEERFKKLSLSNYHYPATSTEFTDHKQASVSRLINSYRIRGHEIARLNPLGTPHHPPVADLDLEFHDLNESDLEHEFDTGSLAVDQPRMKLKDILALCERVYCQSIGVEYMHMVDTVKRDWMRKRLEGSQGFHDINDEDRLRILQMLTAAEGLEKYLHTKYVGQKRFSLEGGDSLIPLLHETMLHAGSNGVEEVVIGMAHRGRLNVLVNILGKSPAMLFDEFEGNHAVNDPDRPGDVKYHLGFASDIQTPGGEVHMALAFNPSHLEIVDPVVLGSARARQVRRKDDTHDKVMPILVHGDAAFSAQGVVMELFQMSEVRGFAVGGTMHIIINNQIGFTTSKLEDTRSTLYCTAVAKMVHAPIFHVNADDPEAVHHVMKIACDFRREFKRDVVIDLVCYRRHGHNEADEPAATQPMMYKTIRGMKTTRQKYAEDLVKRKIVPPDHPQMLMDEYRRKLDDGEQVADVESHPRTNKHAAKWQDFEHGGTFTGRGIETGMDIAEISRLSEKLTTLPDGFKLHPRVNKIIEDRRKMALGEMRLDWGFCETLAYASLVNTGTSLRLVGQDSGRGTFFHRHAVLHSQIDGSVLTPLADLNPKVNVNIIDSLLSEEAVTGFEYGYATAAPGTLVIWEAQFGDFANGAQVVIDQFLSSGEAKWGRLCGLVMFLPHGYEGQGPEHSSARLERFMQLCSNDNIQVCVPSTPAQMFHMIRRQILMKTRKPLIVMTPKSLLRNKASTSLLGDLSNSNYQLLIDDPRITDKKKVKRVVLCSGKVYYDIMDMLGDSKRKDIAVVRVEQLYPIPHEELSSVLGSYPENCEIAWCQEEPQNQGAWYQTIHNLQVHMQDRQTLFYAGRPSSASPAVGYHTVHVEEQNALVKDAITVGAGLKQWAQTFNK
ncbi:MAG: 2-oxoglutarate dehydrogenase E1 component [Xanthomonadales bacterium]|nr:2-oxoglutarate dehydrogenase E1 component [Xanthomonadales bacterium]